MTDIKFTIPSVAIAPGGYIVNCFRVMMTDYSIVLFLSTSSIQNKLRLAVESQGIINGTAVCDIQSFFDVLEMSEEEDHRRMTELLTDGLDNPIDDDGSTPVNYNDIRHDINMKKLPTGMLIKLLKTVSIGLDEEVYITATDARRLRRRYGRRTATTNKSNKGFGI